MSSTPARVASRTGHRLPPSDPFPPTTPARPFAHRPTRQSRHHWRWAPVVTAVTALAITAAVPTLFDGAQRVAARMGDAVTDSDAGFTPPPMPDVEALMTGEPVEVVAGDDLVIPGGELPAAEIASAGGAIIPARAFPRSGTSLDRARAQQCLTTAIYYEAATEPADGKRAVAQVVLNRVLHPAFPNSVCDVVYQGSERVTGCQFSFTCDGSLLRPPARREWEESATVAADALAGRVFAPVGLATHYHTWRVWPRWGRSLVSTVAVGAHIFHRLRGWWGTAPAFRARYAGGEPLPGPHPPSLLIVPSAPVAAAELVATTPIGSTPTPTPGPARASAVTGLAQSTTGRPVATVADARAGLVGRAAPVEADTLPTSTVRAEFARSGQWKTPAAR